MNTRNFKCFQTVYEERNLQVAASKLFLSPQGLSKIIKSLEEECGTPLFSRTKDGFIPTECGKVFYEKSRHISRDLNDLFSSIEAVSDRAERFRVGFAAGTIRVLNIPLIKEFMASHPEFVPSWDEKVNESVLKHVLNDEINFGFVIGKPEAPNLVAELVKSVEMVLYVYKGHRLFDRDYIEISDIKDEPLISMNENYHIYHDVLNACHMNGFNPEIIAKVSEGESIYNLVKNKIGIGVCPKFYKDSEDVRAVSISDAYTWDVYGIYLENSVDTKLAKKFLKHMKQ
ncbi:MAG: LysR family transcriptional regulator [Pseudobutyrivibrio sp.]|nr:LysR family transcriptional regulator [Pseudobutyrivibrio sp.]